MNFVKMHKHPFLHELYTIYDTSNQSMYILGSFFSDIGNRQDLIYFFENWPFDENESDCINTNATCIEKEDRLIYLTSSIPGDDGYDNTALIMTYQQFSELMHNWQEKVCKSKPEEIMITYDNNQFNLETKE